MKLRLKQMYLGQPAGKIVDYGAGVAELLIQRGIAVEVKDDPDADGKAEGGQDGVKKAFFGPPAGKSKRR